MVLIRLRGLRLFALQNPENRFSHVKAHMCLSSITMHVQLSKWHRVSFWPTFILQCTTGAVIVLFGTVHLHRPSSC